MSFLFDEMSVKWPREEHKQGYDIASHDKKSTIWHDTWHKEVNLLRIFFSSLSYSDTYL